MEISFPCMISHQGKMRVIVVPKKYHELIKKFKSDDVKVIIKDI